MYAVFQSGGKQHRVTPGQTIRIEKLEQPEGAVIDFKQVLLVSSADRTQVGTPFVAGGLVTAEVLSHGRGEKVHIVKFRRRKHSLKRQGHRQWFTEIKIRTIHI